MAKEQTASNSATQIHSLRAIPEQRRKAGCRERSEVEANHMSSKDAEQQLHQLFREAFRKQRGVRGPGDDCAVFHPPKASVLHQTVDQVVEGVHVPWGCRPVDFARKLLGRTLSDLAAAGATPWVVSWTICAPARASGRAWLMRLARAFLAECERQSVSVVGGDVSSAPAGAPVVLTCTAMGRAAAAAPGRAGARVGDSILVTGQLGSAVSSGRHLAPQPRLMEGRDLVRDFRPRAMMDLSDGLAIDLGRILQASQVGAEVWLDAIPWADGISDQAEARARALGEGEDYELLAVLSARTARTLLATRQGRQRWTEIGSITPGTRLKWLDQGTPQADFQPLAWQHDLESS